MGSSQVAENCTLSVIPEIETCGGSKSGPLHKYKLDLLKKNILADSMTKDTNKSLQDILSNKYMADIGFKLAGELTCPLNKESGDFIIDSQFDETTANALIDSIKKNKKTEESLFTSIPIIKLISNDKDVLNKFKEYVKSIPPNVSSKQYINSFITNPANQKLMAPGLAVQCKKVNDNINKFLCSDIEELGSINDDVSSKMFKQLRASEALEDQFEIDSDDPEILAAYGFQCKARENHSKHNLNNKLSSTDSWFKEFNSGIRDVGDSENLKKTNDLFCKNYECSDDSVRNLSSCKSGGPISYEDLNKVYGCDTTPVKNTCNQTALKYLEYLSNQKNIQNAYRSLAANSSSDLKDPVSTRKLSNFNENFLGIKNTMKALGIPPTDANIIAKTDDFKARGLVSKPPTYQSPEQVRTLVKDNNINSNKDVASNNYNDNNQVKYAPTYPAPSAIPVNSKSAMRAKEIEIMPKTKKDEELAAVNDELKKIMEEKLAIEKDLKEVEKNSPKKISSSEGLQESQKRLTSKASDERLRRREEQLDNRARELDEYKRELDRRAFEENSANSSNQLASNGSQGSRPQNSGFGTDASNMASRGSSGGLNSPVLAASASNSKQMSPSKPNDDQKANTAALIQSGKETMPISTEELSKIRPDELKDLGIDNSKPFTLRVNFKDKTYEIPVKNIYHKGAIILGPVIAPNNKPLKDFLLSTPLFKPYVEYRKENGSLIN